ncbi:hypothetical protein MTO96_004763 [Rhipicephalus appendiculatus]
MGRRRKLDDLSPQPMYWDPRYKRYFYAGLLPPLDAAVSPRVELEPIKRTHQPSILVTDQASEREERRERHISWSSPDDDDDEGGEDDQRGAAAPARRPAASATSLLTVLSLLSLLAVAFTLWATGALEYTGRTAQTARQDVSATAPIFGTTAPSVRYRADFVTGATTGKPASAPVTTLTDGAETKINAKPGMTTSHGRRRSRSSRRQALTINRVATKKAPGACGAKRELRLHP